jgi:NADPH2:quinone reductase
VRAIRITEFGGPEVLRLVDDAPEPELPPGHQTLSIAHAGINYADTHQAEDSYLAPQKLPLTPGAEAVGTLQDGRRVVSLLDGGGYAERAAAPLPLSFDVPDGVDDGTALALILQGTTAWHLLRTSGHLNPGETVVVHAAAGGVGTLAVQLAKRWGAGQVVAVASSPEKRQLALDLGADVAIDGGGDDLKGDIEDAAGGKVDLVLEMVGGTTTDASLAALAPFGRLVVFGMASRQPPAQIDAGSLMQRSRGVIGFWLAHAMKDPGRLLGEPLAELFGLVQAGDLRGVVGGSYGLSEARQAHAVTSTDADGPSLARFLDAWLGQWPPQLPLDVVISDRRARPGWNGEVVPLLAVWAPDDGCVVSVPPAALDAMDLLGGLGPEVLTQPAWVAAAAQAVGRPGARLRAGVLRAVTDASEVADLDDLGTWVPRGDPSLPAWLRPFDAPHVLLDRADDGTVRGGVGIKAHDPTGAELAVVTEPDHRGRGIGRRLVATATRRVLAEGRAALYLHDPGNTASARLAEAVGFRDHGWRIVDLDDQR